MKHCFIAILLMFSIINLSAQEIDNNSSDSGSSIASTSNEESHAIKEVLSSFTAIDVDASIELTLVKLKSNEAPYVVYDTKGAYTSKFSAVVDDKSKTLKISERNDPKRESITEVKVYFSELTDIHISKARTKVEGTLTSQIIDVYISGDATFTADIDVLDIKLVVSGKSRVVLTGNTHYQSANIYTAEYDGSALSTIATNVEVSHNAVAKVNAVERLEAKTATGAQVLYYTQPVILRSEVALFGGEIIRM